MKKSSVWPILALTFILLQSCRTIEPIAPVENVEKPSPKIQNLPSLSTISIPVVISLQQYYSLAEKQVDNDFHGGEHPCEGVSFDYFFHRNPFEISATDNKIQLDISGKYWIKMSYCVTCSDVVTDKPVCVLPRIPFSCGVSEPMRRMEMQYTTSFAIENDYSLKTKTYLTELKAIDPCEVTVFKYDATDKLLKEVRKSLKDLAQDIDRQLSAVSFKKEAESAWKTLNAPIKVKDLGILHVNPKSIFLSEPVIKNDSLHTTLSLIVDPVFNHNNTSTPSKLPELNVISQPKSDSFDLNIAFQLNYDSLSKTIQQYAGGQQLQLKGKTIIFDSVSIAGADNNELIVRVKFSGSKKGLMYLRGTPKYDPAEETLELTNVSYDLATKSVLLKTADWLFDDKIIQKITEASKQDLRPQFAKLSKSVNDAFHYNYNEYNVKGKVSKIQVLDLNNRSTELYVLVKIAGKMEVDNFGK